jgi:hypothetical protein
MLALEVLEEMEAVRQAPQDYLEAAGLQRQQLQPARLRQVAAGQAVR